jgi:hypothetical protein
MIVVFGVVNITWVVLKLKNILMATRIGMDTDPWNIALGIMT